MTVTVYPGKLVDEQGTKMWDSPFPLGAGEKTKYYPDAEARMERGEDTEYPNPDFIPFADMTMAEGNLLLILQMMKVPFRRDDRDEGWGGDADIHEVFQKAHDFLIINGWVRNMEQYVFERVLALRSMAELGITRGCTHIVWA